MRQVLTTDGVPPVDYLKTAKKTFCLKVSNLGGGVQCLQEGKEWQVNLPSTLTNRGSCQITVTKASISIHEHGAGHPLKDVTKMWVQTNIPKLGFDTEVALGSTSATGYSELFDVQWEYNVDKRTYYMNNPTYFRCFNLPPSIAFRSLYLAQANSEAISQVNPGVYNPGYPVDLGVAKTPIIEFHLLIEFDHDFD